MNTLQLKHDLLMNICSLHENVYASDQLPKTPIPIPASMIINLDKSTQKGSHWVCVYIDVQKRAEYFCSYGLPPLRTEFIDFMKRNSNIWTHSTQPLQSYDSTVCGKYCAVYLYFKTQHYSLKDFLAFFSEDRVNNDRVITYLYDVIFHKTGRQSYRADISARVDSLLKTLMGKNLEYHCKNNSIAKAMNLLYIG